MSQNSRIAAAFLAVALASYGGVASAQTTLPRTEEATGSISSEERAQSVGTPERNVTRRGETVPHPGASQTGPETEREKQAQRRSDDATKMICKGC